MKFVFRIVTLAALPFAGAFAESLLKIAGEDPIPVRREIFGVNQLAYGDVTDWWSQAPTPWFRN